MISAKTDWSSSAVRAKVSLVSLPPYYSTPFIHFEVSSARSRGFLIRLPHKD